MVVSASSSLGLPHLRGNPFDLRPIERGRANELIGREKTLMTWREHIHSQSPRMILLVGERGSGRTSLINAISSQTSNYFVGQYWHDDDPMRRVLSEISAHFNGHESPGTMHQTIEQIVGSLDEKTGPLPLIAFDYPAEIEIAHFLSMITPILQRLRAFIVISLSASQFSLLGDNAKKQFDSAVILGPLSKAEIQSLSDTRMVKTAREKWRISQKILESLHSRTGGNPKEVISTLRDLVDEERGLGCDGALDRLLAWDRINYPESTIPPNGDVVIEEKDTIPDGKTRSTLLSDSLHHFQETEHGASFDDNDPEDMWDQELEEDDPEDMWDQELGESSPMKDFPEERETFGNFTMEKLETETNNGSKDQLETHTRFLPTRKGELNESQHLPKEKHPNKQESGFIGLMGRSKITTDSMPTGPFTDLEESNIPFSPLLSENNSPTFDTKAPIIETRSDRSSNFDGTKVFSSEGELWTVDSEMETTLLEDPSIHPVEAQLAPLGQAEIPYDAEPSIDIATKNPLEKTHSAPEWASETDIDQTHLQSLSDAEKLVVSISRDREVSPSDPEIQARLEVGRPRLSQIFNSLRRSGILCVRKKGRSRLFKLSDQASDLV